MLRLVAGLATAALVLSATPVGAASPSPGPASGWTGVIMPQAGAANLLAVGVAAGPGLSVAVGDNVCEEAGRETWQCWAQAWTSSDGVTWQAVDARASGLDLGYRVMIDSGPTVGVGGIAYGPGGFLVFGRAQDTRKGGQRSAIWRSADGASWERVATGDAFPRTARLRTILGAADGYLVGGVIYGELTPRAAIWSSPDGERWVPAPGKGVFKVGPYLETMEDPGAGGIEAFALQAAPADGSGSLANGVVASGTTCVGFVEVGSVRCQAQVWRSRDGRTWRKDDVPATFGGASTVAAIGDRVVADAPSCLGGGDWGDWDCPPLLLVSDEVAGWRFAYGSPVDGRLVAMTSAAGRLHAVLAIEAAPDVPDSLAVWSSDDGTNWRPDADQPTLPVTGILQDVSVVPFGGRLLIVAGMITDEGTGVSVALLGPELE